MSEQLNPSLEIVVGLPGAGKTTYLNQLLESAVIDGYYDDYQQGAPEDDKSNPRKSPRFNSLESDIQEGKRIAIADIRYCVDNELRLVMESFRQLWPRLPITVTAFANNPEACKHNVRTRARPERLEIELRYIDEHSPHYQASGDRVLPVIMG